MDGNLQAAQGLDKDVACDFASFPVVKSSGISLTNLRNARRLLRDRKPDMLLTYNWGTIDVAIATWPWSAFRHVHVEDGFGPDESPQRQNPRRVLMRRLALSRCAAIIVPSATLFDVATRIWRFPPSRVVHLPNGIDCERFARAADAASLASCRNRRHRPGHRHGCRAAPRKEPVAVASRLRGVAAHHGRPAGSSSAMAQSATSWAPTPRASASPSASS